MKRATLTAYPTTPPSEPADLTDRLLEREDGQTAASARMSPKRRRAQPRPRPALVEPGAEAPQVPAPETRASQASSSLEAALAGADSAADALRQASREAPARYDVALRYRLDALAHHLQQVKEFVASLAAR
jgi:hypothetical protein